MTSVTTSNDKKMRVLLSWSGPSSRQLARLLQDWLPDVLQSVEPWMSEDDIPKGAWWAEELQNAMRQASMCVVCITPDSVASSWLHFEAGFLAHAVGKTVVCPYLHGVRPTDLVGPLAQLQVASAQAQDTFRLLKTLNERLGVLALPAERLRRAFDLFWPQLETGLLRVLATDNNTIVQRSDSDILAEILTRVRNLEIESSQSTHDTLIIKKWLERRIRTLREAATQPDLYGENPEYPETPSKEERQSWTVRANALESELRGT